MTFSASLVVPRLFWTRVKEVHFTRDETRVATGHVTPLDARGTLLTLRYRVVQYGMYVYEANFCVEFSHDLLHVYKAVLKWTVSVHGSFI